MKKLMIAAAIVCAAAISHAASVTWSVQYLGDPVDGTAYLASGCIGQLFAASDVTIAALSQDLAKGDFTKWNTYGIQEKAVSGGEGEIVAGSVYGDKTAGTYDFYFAVINADKTSGATYFFASDTMSLTLADGKGNESIASFGDYEEASGAGNWTKISSGPTPPTPEPTSAMLLLLGVAGLALRRKAK